VCLGLLTGPATATAATSGPARLAPGRRWGLVAACWVVLCAQAIPFLAGEQIKASQRAVEAGDLPGALESARSARALQPWASSPYRQAALVHEEAGDLGPARTAAAEAIERDEGDWRLQVIAARLAVKDDDVPAARRALARARELNPRSQLLEAARQRRR
jgi:tetratricopeptide (TPR) repeat protein